MTMPNPSAYLTRHPTCSQCGAPSVAVALVDDGKADLAARRYTLAALCPEHHRAWVLGQRAGRN